ncbi:hypothetical protein Dimus_010472 [Dionaea muscipula]
MECLEVGHEQGSCWRARQGSKPTHRFIKTWILKHRNDLQRDPRPTDKTHSLGYHNLEAGLPTISDTTLGSKHLHTAADRGKETSSDSIEGGIIQHDRGKGAMSCDPIGQAPAGGANMVDGEGFTLVTRRKTRTDQGKDKEVDIMDILESKLTEEKLGITMKKQFDAWEFVTNFQFHPNGRNPHSLEPKGGHGQRKIMLLIK